MPLKGCQLECGTLERRRGRGAPPKAEEDQVPDVATSLQAASNAGTQNFRLTRERTPGHGCEGWEL